MLKSIHRFLTLTRHERLLDHYLRTGGMAENDRLFNVGMLSTVPKAQMRASLRETMQQPHISAIRAFRLHLVEQRMGSVFG